MKKWKFATKVVQEGYRPNPGEPRILPICQSTTYQYNDADHVAGLFDLTTSGHMYSRISNPTVAAFEEKINALEGGIGAVATSSGQAATTLALLNICQAGQHIVSLSTIYGGTYTLLSSTFKKLGIQVTFIGPEMEDEEIEKAFQSNTRALFAETIGNPGLNILDLERFSSIAKKMDVPFIIDNTFATPYLLRPFDHGANIIIHSSTKYIDGHATSVGGVVIDGGNYNWANGKYPEITKPDASYHGLKFIEAFQEKAYITKLRVTLLRDLGPTMSPFNAFLSNLGLETLHLRMKKHSENALELAHFLKGHPNVAWVKYPGLPDSPDYPLVQKYLPLGASGILTFGVKGGASQGKAFINLVKLASLVIHVGDIRTHVLHPASTTHRQLTETQQLASGVSPDLIRVSVGIEDISDIRDDFDQALKNI